MVTMDKVQQGLALFIDRELIPSLTGWDKVLVGGAAGLMAANLPKMAAQLAAQPMVAALGVYDPSTNQLDIDALYHAATPYMGAESLPLKLPLLGMTVKMGRAEVDALYRYIKEA